MNALAVTDGASKAFFNANSGDAASFTVQSLDTVPHGIGFSANRDNSIFGRSETTQTASILALAIIKS